MLDKNYLRHNKDSVSNFKFRGFSFNYFFFEKLDLKIRFFKTKIYKLQYKHNVLSSIVKTLKHADFTFSYFLSEIFFLKYLMININDKLIYLEKIFNDFLLRIPNLLHKSVYYGLNEIDNVEIRVFLYNSFKNRSLLKDFEADKKYIDFETASKISGSGFVVLKSYLAQLYRALGNYMLDLHIFEHGYKEIYSPLIVKEQTMINSGQLPKFSKDQFSIMDSDMWLIPTAEVVLTNIVANSNVQLNDLPLKFVSKTACFRKERGSYGSRVRGLIRQHQFDKVELVNIVLPSDSYLYLEELVYQAEKVLQNLFLPYRIISLCSSDVGFSSAKTYDIEAWFPKRKMYIEVSSCSNTETFQSIRMKSKIFDGSKFFCYPHMLNGSGLALGRVLLCLIENYSDLNGDLIIPDVLLKYMNGIEKITVSI
ncbi:MAG TPA: serine--tRNA ligase [Candidatus Azoamicus sp. MARI]